jgi:hypothetical protein
MNLVIQWEHRLQLLGGKMHPESFRTLVAAYDMADLLRRGGERVVAVLSTPKQVVTTSLGGQC